MHFPILIAWLFSLIRASKLDAIDLVFEIDDKHKIILHEVEGTCIKLVKGLEAEYKELSNLIDIVECSSVCLCTYAKDLCSINGSALSSSEELRTTVKPKIDAKVEELRGLISALDNVEETRVLEDDEIDYLVSLRSRIDFEVVKLEDGLVNTAGLDRRLHERLDALTLTVYQRLMSSLSFERQFVTSLQEVLDNNLETVPHPVSYVIISELCNQLQDYATAYKQYFSLFSAIILLKQNFLEILPADPIDFLPDYENHFFNTLTTMNKDMRMVCDLDQPLPVQKLRKAKNIVQLEEEFWHFYYLLNENKSHLYNKDDYENLFNQYSEDKDIQVGLLEGNVMVKAVVLDAIVINPDGCYISKEHPLDELVSRGIVYTVCSAVPDIIAHPEWIEKLVPPAGERVILNLKGIRELRKRIFNQFQIALSSGLSTIIVNHMGCAKCKATMSQVAHVYAEAVKYFSKQGIQALYFVEEELYSAVLKFVKTY